MLLDTHVFLWVLGDPERLTAETRHRLADDDNAVFVGVVSLWEIVVKHRIGKLEAEVNAVAEHLAPASKIARLDIMVPHLLTLDRLPLHQHHKDPFDHLLIAQAMAEGMTLVTNDDRVALYPVLTLKP